MHPDQRGRAMDAGLGLWRGVGMKSVRLIEVVMPRLVLRSFLIEPEITDELIGVFELLDA
jgi:hypothetical protein